MLYCVLCFKFNIYKLSNLELANLGLGASKVEDQLITLLEHINFKAFKSLLSFHQLAQN